MTEDSSEIVTVSAPKTANNRIEFNNIVCSDSHQNTQSTFDKFSGGQTMEDERGCDISDDDEDEIPLYKKVQILCRIQEGNFG